MAYGIPEGGLVPIFPACWNASAAKTSPSKSVHRRLGASRSANNTPTLILIRAAQKLGIPFTLASDARHSQAQLAE